VLSPHQQLKDKEAQEELEVVPKQLPRRNKDARGTFTPAEPHPCRNTARHHDRGIGSGEGARHMTLVADVNTMTVSQVDATCANRHKDNHKGVRPYVVPGVQPGGDHDIKREGDALSMESSGGVFMAAWSMEPRGGAIMDAENQVGARGAYAHLDSHKGVVPCVAGSVEAEGGSFRSDHTDGHKGVAPYVARGINTDEGEGAGLHDVGAGGDVSPMEPGGGLVMSIRDGPYAVAHAKGGDTGALLDPVRGGALPTESRGGVIMAAWSMEPRGGVIMDAESQGCAGGGLTPTGTATKG
jgi:hypothetical protein